MWNCAANDNGEGPGDVCGFFASTASRTDKGAQRRFIAAVMAISTADEMLADGDVASGIAAYRKAIDLCPPCLERGNFQLLLGGILFEQGDAAGAATEIRTALSQGCRYPYEASRRLAFAHAVLGDFGAATAAMAEAREAGEDIAYATQALAIFELAQHGLAAALRVAEPDPAQADSQAEYRCRLALVRAELHRLAGNRSAALADLELAAETAKQEALEIELALWLAMLDRHFGRAGVRPDVEAAFAAEPDHWVTLAWKILSGDGSRDDLVRRLAKAAWTLRAENLAIFDRFAGLQAEAAGDLAAARASYAAAREVPHTRWCIDYHLAGLALAQGSVPPIP